MSEWNAAQYLKYRKERTQPAIDLARRIEMQSPQRIMDIGCGPGNSTAVLKERFPDAYILGIDSSQDMIDRARKEQPGLDFMLCDVSRDLDSFTESFDVIFSNACLQWIPDHPAVLKNLMGLLKENGILAVQIPMNFDEPIHQIIREIVKSQRWADKLFDLRTFYTLTPECYFDLLSELSSDFTMWRTVYYHRMGSHEGIMDWYRGTGLRPYLSALEEKDRAVFEGEVYHEVVKRYPVQKNGEIIFPFPRLFFMAVK
ncbi:methyltransferase domain-containing protein [Massiliimalia massiliensis]|uniref:methyltransferase domain-containing protein n=1 Tax=Massiliimalia massiliensis TaxID=1852384 RepID=UPI000984A66A|nr:methyltransferase domain-containing protein [Massiliimalia massiliensis]